MNRNTDSNGLRNEFIGLEQRFALSKYVGDPYTLKWSKKQLIRNLFSGTANQLAILFTDIRGNQLKKIANSESRNILSVIWIDVSSQADCRLQPRCDAIDKNCRDSLIRTI